jgi:hypothetical protein
MKRLIALIAGLLVSGAVFAAHPGIESQETYGNVLLEHNEPGAPTASMQGPESLQAVLDPDENWGSILYDVKKPVPPAMLPPQYGDVTAPGYNSDTYGSVLRDVGAQF